MVTPTYSTRPSPGAAARSLQVFGLYLCATGAGLLLAPALVLAPLELPVPKDAWIRMVGILALALGATDLLAARTALPLLLRASVWRRVAAGACMVLLVAAALAPPALLLLAAVDLAAAGWTAWALRRASAHSQAHSSAHAHVAGVGAPVQAVSAQTSGSTA